MPCLLFPSAHFHSCQCRKDLKLSNFASGKWPFWYYRHNLVEQIVKWVENWRDHLWLDSRRSKGWHPAGTKQWAEYSGPDAGVHVARHFHQQAGEDTECAFSRCVDGAKLGAATGVANLNQRDKPGHEANVKLVEFSKKKQNGLHLGQNSPLHW